MKQNKLLKHVVSPFRTEFIYALIFLCIVAVAYVQIKTNQALFSRLLPTGSAFSATSTGVLLREDFEGGSVFSGLHDQFGTSHAFQVVSSPAFEGARSGRFELRDSDPITSGGTRAEVLFPESSAGKERWYSFRAFFPAGGYKADSNNDILSQWHQGGGTGSPSTTLRVKNDRFFMKIGSSKDSRRDFDMGPQTKDAWHEFVIHIVHSHGPDGLVEVWHNGRKVLAHRGGNMYEAPLPRWKVGIYKDDWNGSETTDASSRVFFLDNLILGDENATLQTMSSGTSNSLTPAEPAPAPTAPTQPAPTAPSEPESGPVTGTGQISGFTLVDSHTEKDVFTIADGAIISLSSLENTKLNIRANTSSTFAGSVKLELSGAQRKTYTDKAAPYALHGDNGGGNFYYGNWNPPATGTYQLKATPYDRNGTAGTPVAITFTIK